MHNLQSTYLNREMVFIVSSYLLEPNSKNPNSPKQKIVDEGQEWHCINKTGKKFVIALVIDTITHNFGLYLPFQIELWRVERKTRQFSYFA